MVIAFILFIVTYHYYHKNKTLPSVKQLDTIIDNTSNKALPISNDTVISVNNPNETHGQLKKLDFVDEYSNTDINSEIDKNPGIVLFDQIEGENDILQGFPDIKNPTIKYTPERILTKHV